MQLVMRFTSVMPLATETDMSQSDKQDEHIKSLKKITDRLERTEEGGGEEEMKV